jgi:GT2 family glycosyltransferase
VSTQLSILVVSWNTREKTVACLNSIEIGLRGAASHETIVIENGSTDGSVEALVGRSDIRLVPNSENRGYAAAVNQAYSLANGELILLLNSDIRFTPDALATLVEFLEHNPKVAGVGPRYLNPDGTPQAHHYRLPSFSAMLANSSVVLRRVPRLRRRIRAYRMLDDDFSRPRPIEQPSASCLLLRRACLPAASIMDERFPIYFNDVALARWLAQHRSELWMTPDAAVYHDHGASTRLMGSAHTRQYLGAQVRYLRTTERWDRIGVFRIVIFAEYFARFLLRHPGAMTLRDLVAALGGDPGPLLHAQAPTE